jgi:DNA repair protein RadC
MGTVADAVAYAPPEHLVDLPVHTRPNPRKKKAPDDRSDEFKLFDGHDGLLVRTVLVRASNYADEKNVVRISSSSDIVRLCDHMRMLDQEHMVVLAVNNAMEVNAIFEAAKGTQASAAFMAFDILKVPILSGCLNFIVVHNHPSGAPKPSPDDFKTTDSLRGASKCVGLRLLDHVIIARNGHFSFAAEGAL